LAKNRDNLNDTQGEQTENNWAARVDESEEAKRDEDGGEENKDVHPNFMTLDEYKALRNEINKKNEFNIRQPGEGEDQSKWPKTYLLAKKKDEEDDNLCFITKKKYKTSILKPKKIK
jgi:plasminogen activator inhibitor 1 RNA-binding protein